MGGFQYKDIFATKGIEYLVILAFLVLLVLYIRLLNKQAKGAKQKKTDEGKLMSLVGFFTVIADYYYHWGHTWIKIEKINGEEQAWVGINDFAKKLLGKIDEFKMPKPGTELAQGEAGWTVKIAGKEIEIISPVNGIVEEINEALIKSPHKLTCASFSHNWLLKVKATKFESSINNLLSGNMATTWMFEEIKRLQKDIPEDLWANFSAKEIETKGFARLVDENNWDPFARKFLNPGK